MVIGINPNTIPDNNGSTIIYKYNKKQENCQVAASLAAYITSTVIC